MKKFFSFILIFILVHGGAVVAQPSINRIRFFRDDKMISMELSTDLKTLINKKKQDTYQPATVTMHFPDSSILSESIRLSARGDYRRTECYVPSIKLDFKNPGSPKLSPLHQLKLVVGCGTHADDERLILKEYLVYKIYNLLTDMSFRVRLLQITYYDTRKKIKPYTQYGFLIENIDDMAKRNKCREVEKQAFNMSRTDRPQMFIVAMFQFMIGNTDWSVPNYHNIKLMRPKTDTLSFPYVIPYDFDFSGLVDAPYAIPKEDLGIASVRERLYRGLRATPGEVQETLDVFRQKKEMIKKLVTKFEFLNQRQREEMLDYMDEFFKTIESKNETQKIFIDGVE